MTFQSELPKLVLPSGDLRALPSTLGEGGESAISHMGSTQALSHRRGEIGLGDSMASYKQGLAKKTIGEQ